MFILCVCVCACVLLCHCVCIRRRGGHLGNCIYLHGGSEYSCHSQFLPDSAPSLGLSPLPLQVYCNELWFASVRHLSSPLLSALFFFLSLSLSPRLQPARQPANQTFNQTSRQPACPSVIRLQSVCESVRLTAVTSGGRIVSWSASPGWWVRAESSVESVMVRFRHQLLSRPS